MTPSTKQYYETVSAAFERIAAMVLTLDRSQLFDHLDDKEDIKLGSIMFVEIVDRVADTQKQLGALLDQSMAEKGGAA